MKSSYVIDKHIKKTFNLKELGSTNIGIFIDGKSLTYDLGYLLPRYRIGDNKPSTFDYSAWGSDIGEYIEIYGLEPQSISVEYPKNPSKKINFKNLISREVKYQKVMGKERFYRINREAFSDILNTKPWFRFSILSEGEKYFLDVNMSNTFDDIQPYISNNHLKFDFRFKGKNHFRLRIKGKNSSLYKEVMIEEPKDFNIFLGSNEDVSLTLDEIDKDNKVVFSKNKSVEREKIIVFECLGIYLSGKKSQKIYPTFKIDRIVRESPNTYTGNIYYEIYTHKEYLKTLNPVKLDLIKKVSDKRTAYIFNVADKDGDSLLFNKETGKISNEFRKKFNDVEKIICVEKEL